MLRALPHFTNLLTKLFCCVYKTMALLHGASGRIPFNSLQGISILLEPLPCPVVHSAQPTYSHECHYSQQTAISPLCLPQGIRIVNKGQQFTVVSYRASISKGTRFGPYRGRVVQPSQVKEGEDNEYSWEVSIVKPLRNNNSVLTLYNHTMLKFFQWELNRLHESLLANSWHSYLDVYFWYQIVVLTTTKPDTEHALASTNVFGIFISFEKASFKKI